METQNEKNRLYSVGNIDVLRTHQLLKLWEAKNRYLLKIFIPTDFVKDSNEPNIIKPKNKTPNL